jgi:hypothetical protein
MLSKGWRVSLIDDGRTRHFIVGLADGEAAKELAITQCSEKLALDGQIIESSEIG